MDVVLNECVIERCVVVGVQGKGEITTWWLTGENNAEFPELAPPAVSRESNNSETDKCDDDFKLL